MTEFFTEKEEKPDLEDAVLLEGLPGIGNVARVAVDFLIDKLDAKKYVTIFSDCFPKSVFIDEDSLIRLPKVEIYYKKRGEGKDLVFLIGDVQPQESKDNYTLMLKVLEFAKELKVNEIITLGGIGMRNPSPEKIHGAGSNKEIKKKFEDYDVIFDGNGTVNLIVGAAGLLLGLGERKEISGISLLSETHAKPGKIGLESSKSLLKILEDYLELELPLDELKKELKEGIGLKKKGGKEIKKLKQMLEKYSNKKDLSYIG